MGGCSGKKVRTKGRPPSTENSVGRKRRNLLLVFLSFSPGLHTTKPKTKNHNVHKAIQVCSLTLYLLELYKIFLCQISTLSVRV